MKNDMPSTQPATDIEIAETLKTAKENILTELKKRIIGQNEVIEQLLIALFSQGHCLLVGVPGLAKTLLISTFAQILKLPFNRIQFTPDLMPSDIIGTDIIEEDGTGKRAFRFIKGPVFANIVLADEINRTPPKTQAALLQAMQEYQVTAGGRTYFLERPFFVLATQNPIEQEGTYPLPEAQLDRFMFHITLDYPDKTSEKEIVMTTTAAYEPEINAVITGEEVLQIQQVVRKVPIAEAIVEYAVELNRQTRPAPDAYDFIQDWVQWGAGPRASQYLVLGAKARAILHGRYHVAYEDIKAVAIPVLRHRILTNFNAEADGITSLDIINRLLESVEPPPVE
ncbi:MAG: MoxR family ATPase [Candidatus Poribacteria bacterium]|nr:MoxR family ATPase [Candidatus Poribacteria bacterium]MYK18129.1 MoxR family ATPase [Candidatus Poribacteria bacterium]